MNNQTNVAATPLQPIVMASVPQVTLPKPYYQDDSVTIYHGDCRDILPSLPAFDLLLTDPPYGLGDKWNGGGGGEKSSWAFNPGETVRATVAVLIAITTKISRFARLTFSSQSGTDANSAAFYC